MNISRVIQKNKQYLFYSRIVCEIVQSWLFQFFQIVCWKGLWWKMFQCLLNFTENVFHHQVGPMLHLLRIKHLVFFKKRKHKRKKIFSFPINSSYFYYFHVLWIAELSCYLSAWLVYYMTIELMSESVYFIIHALRLT